MLIILTKRKNLSTLKVLNQFKKELKFQNICLVQVKSKDTDQFKK